ncbi:MAG: DNA topoisomerase I [Marinobacterium sp.]|nr:DNA topoisomerase I [Marinobacterium sp.]
MLDNIMYVALLAVVGVIALTANYILATKEQQQKAKDERLKFLSVQAEHTIQAVAILREANCKADIINKVDEHIMSLVEEVGMLAPDSPLYADLTAQKSNADTILPDEAAFASDKALKRAQIYINFAEKLIMQMARHSKLTTTLARSYQQELYRMKVSVVVGAHMAQGIRYKDRDEPLVALSHFKHAKALLVGSALPAVQKKERLSELQMLIGEVEPKRNSKLGNQLSQDMDRFW